MDEHGQQYSIDRGLVFHPLNSPFSSSRPTTSPAIRAEFHANPFIQKNIQDCSAATRDVKHRNLSASLQFDSSSSVSSERRRPVDGGDVDFRQGPVDGVDDTGQKMMAEMKSSSSTLDLTVRRQLFRMLPDLMSEANYKRLVDGGHVPRLEEDDVVDDNGDVEQSRLASSMSANEDEKVSTTKKGNTMSADDESQQVEMTSQDRTAAEQRNAIFVCHICSYVCQSKTLFDDHMHSVHYVYSCSYCKYSAKTSGRLQRHVTDFHTGTRRQSSSLGGGTNGAAAARRRYKCKRCDYVTDNQVDYWCHGRQHINPKDLYDCPACQFATRFKHHMMYHVLSHLDVNPYSCEECGYPCKNKSMLKSHKKTHTNVYPYRCAYPGCSYVTKYCHAMNQHLARFTDHVAAEVLNADGSLPSVPHATVQTVNDVDIKVPAVDVVTRPRKEPSTNTQQPSNTAHHVNSRRPQDDVNVNVCGSKPFPFPVGDTQSASMKIPQGIHPPLLFPPVIPGISSLPTTWPTPWSLPLGVLAKPHSDRLAAAAATAAAMAASAAAVGGLPALRSLFYPPVPFPLPALPATSMSALPLGGSWPLRISATPSLTASAGWTTHEDNYSVSTAGTSHPVERYSSPSRTLGSLHSPWTSADNKHQVEVNRSEHNMDRKRPRFDDRETEPLNSKRKRVRSTSPANDDGRDRRSTNDGDNVDVMNAEPTTMIDVDDNSDCPIDLTTAKETSSAAVQSSGRCHMASGENAVNVVEELRRLNCLVGFVDARAVDGIKRVLNSPPPSSTISEAGVRQQPPKSAIKEDPLITGNENCDKDRASLPPPSKSNKDLTPPTSDSLLALTMPSVARRLDSGFVGGCERPVCRSHMTEGYSRRSVSDIEPSHRNGEKNITSPSDSISGASGGSMTSPEIDHVRLDFRSYLDSDSSDDRRCGSADVGDGIAEGRKNAKYECPCGVFYAHRDTYEMHMALHYSVSEPFRCRLCDRRYDGAVDFYRHVGTYQHNVTQSPH